MTIFIPAAAASSATALPMPLAPPVITATLPCRSSMDPSSVAPRGSVAVKHGLVVGASATVRCR